MQTPSLRGYRPEARSSSRVVSRALPGLPLSPEKSVSPQRKGAQAHSCSYMHCHEEPRGLLKSPRPPQTQLPGWDRAGPRRPPPLPPGAVPSGPVAQWPKVASGFKLTVHVVNGVEAAGRTQVSRFASNCVSSPEVGPPDEVQSCCCVGSLRLKPGRSPGVHGRSCLWVNGAGAGEVPSAVQSLDAAPWRRCGLAGSLGS